MIPVLYSAAETSFATNGLGGLANAISCYVTETRNTVGGYFLNMEYPLDGIHFGDILPERIIYASPAPRKKPQPFRIVRITKPINGVVKIEAPHVSTALQSIVTYGTHSAQSFTGITYDYAQTARSLGQAFPFWFASDMTFAQKTIAFPEPIDFMSVLMGADGSILDNYGGEYEFDGFKVSLLNQRGHDSGIEVRYGVNMTQLDAETDASDLVTAVLPYWKGRVNDTDTFVYGDLCKSLNASAFATLRAIPFDATQKIGSDSQPTKAQVTAAGQAYINSTATSELAMSITTSFAPALIGDRPLYLCDTVKVVHPDLGVSSTAKVVETRFNVLTGQYESITIGSIRKSIVDTIADIIKK